jgi:hypothetical protein
VKTFTTAALIGLLLTALTASVRADDERNDDQARERMTVR